MKYWVFIKEKVEGPYDENSLVTLQGFTPDTLICSEESASKGQQEWVKASSIFEFDEVPVTQPMGDLPAQEPAPVASNAASAIDAAVLLDKLNLISSEMLHLQEKLEHMQKRLDTALEKPVNPIPQETPISSEEDDKRVQTITLSTHVFPKKDSTDNLEGETTQASSEKQDSTQTASGAENAAQGTSDKENPAQAIPEEDAVIQSALDSMYAGKLASLMQEDTFQDLLPEKTQQQQKAAEEEAVKAIGKELEFIPVSEEDQEVLQEALITTPSVEEIAKDALINEMTASPKEDVIDQIIQEHQEKPSDLEDLDLPLEPVAEETPTNDIPLEETQPEPVKQEDIPLELNSQSEPTKQETEPAEQPGEKLDFSAAAMAVGALAIGGAAALAAKTEDKPSQQQDSEVSENNTLEIAPDKNQPEQVEPVLPAEQMPEDVPQAEQSQEDVAAVTDLPSLHETEPKPQEQESTDATENNQEQAPLQEDLPATAPTSQQSQTQEKDAAEHVDAPHIPTPTTTLPTLDEAGNLPETQSSETEPENAIEELVTKHQKKAEYIPEAEPADQGLVTDKDLEEAFGPMAATEEAQQPEQSSPEESSSSDNSPAENQQPQGSNQSEEAAAPKDMEGSLDEGEMTHASNPNDLTEIELKEGSTYLISDFVPPAQVTDNVAEVMGVQQPDGQEKNLENTAFQDMLAATITNQSTQPLPSDGLPEDIAATQVNLENTIQAKRGATLDIKTVPMVPEPSQTNRLDVNELNDVNAQHGMRRSGSSVTKFVVGGLVAILLAIIAYVLLGMMKVLPASINLFANKKPAVTSTQPEEELFEQETPAPVAQPQPGLEEQALSRVQQFPLPNGYSLKAFIESKHAFAQPEMISWTAVEAVEPDNYAITVKVPPENPQSYQTAYRFNYNMITGLLEPTISDAKNLLDEAYGFQQQAQVTQEQPVAQPNTPKNTTSNQTKGTKAKRPAKTGRTK